MKKKLFFALAALVSMVSTAKADVEINATNFPDENFRNFLLSQSYGSDGVITTDELVSITEINTWQWVNKGPSYRILDFTGIEHFTALQVLNIYANGPTSLNLSANTALTELDCSYCPLPSLDLSHNTALKKLSVPYTPLTALDLSANTALTYLDCCHDTLLTSIDVSNCPELDRLLAVGDSVLTSIDVHGKTELSILQCYGSGVTSINASGCSALSILECYNSPLASLDLTGCTGYLYIRCMKTNLTSLTGLSDCVGLRRLDCSECNLTALDVTACPELMELVCYSNNIGALNVSNNTLLTKLSCSGNNLSSLDVSNNPQLVTLGCAENNLAALDLSNNLQLKELWVSNNNLTSLDVSGHEQLESFYCANNDLTLLDLADCKKLTQLVTDGTQITTLDVSGCSALTRLTCPESLVTLDMSGCTGLTTFDHYGSAANPKNLVTLNAAGCTALTHLYCYYNQLTSLDVSGCTALTEFSCGSNQLTSLDVSDFTALRVFSCGNNQLTSLDVSNNMVLKSLVCSGNNFASLDVSNHTGLTNLQCGGAALTSLNAFGCSALASFTPVNITSLTSLNLSGTAVEKLTINDMSSLKTLDISNNTELWQLDVQRNGLTSLNVAGCTALLYLYCNENSLTSLNVKGCTKLRYLYCQENSLTSLDFTGCPALYSVFIYENRINLNSMRNLINTIETTGRVLARAYDSTSETEGNVISAAQVAAFNAKNWYIDYIPAVGSQWTTYGGMSDVAYDLWVNGTQVTSNNCEDIENLTNWDQGCMSYDEMTNTLTLDNVYIGSTAAYAIRDSIPDLTIQLIGESTLNMSDGDGLRTYFDATITGQGKLTLKSGKTNGIYIYNGTLTVTGGAQVYADASAATAQASLTAQKGCGICCRIYTRNIGTTTRITYYGSLNVEGNGTRVSAIGSLMSMGPLKALTYPLAGTLTVLNAANTEVTGYFKNNAVCLRSGDGSLTSPYTYTPTTFLVTLTCPEDGFAIDEAHFPDAQFRAYLLSQSYGTDAWLTNDEIASITTLSMNNQGIADLTGVGYFTALKELWVNGNALTTADLSELPLLVNVEVMNNQLSTEALTALIASLPTYEEMAMRVLCLYGEYSGTEGNAVPTAEQRLAVWQKGWFPKYRLASGGFENYPMPGDTDEDMRLTDADIHILAEMLAGKRTTNDESDFDCDGNTSLSDLTKLVNWLKR